ARRPQHAGPRGRGVHVVRDEPQRARRRGVRGGGSRADCGRDRRVPARARASRGGGPTMNARVLDRSVLYAGAIFLAIWVLLAFYLIAISAFTPQAKIFDYPKPLVQIGRASCRERIDITVG